MFTESTMIETWRETFADVERQRFIDLVFVASLAGAATTALPDFVLARAYNLAEEAWDLRKERRTLYADQVTYPKRLAEAQARQAALKEESE